MVARLVITTVLIAVLFPRLEASGGVAEGGAPVQTLVAEEYSPAELSNLLEQIQRVNLPPPPEEPPAPVAVEKKKNPDMGRWHRARPGAAKPAMTPEQQQMAEQLEALGYLGGTVEAGEESNVTVYDRERAHAGLNFWTSGHAPEALLMDMEGNVLHTWRYEYEKIWPEGRPNIYAPGADNWRRAYLFENGDVIAIFESCGIIKVDKDSNLIWSNGVRAHHDLEIMPNGDIWVLTRKAHMIPRVNVGRPILEDFISILGPDGVEKRRISLLEALENSDFAYAFEESPKKRGDIFHTNTLQILDGRLAEKDPAFKAGNVMTSLLILSAIAVVDPELEKVVWLHQGDFHLQHDPKILNNGNLMFLDNQGRRNASTVYEIDPISRETVWKYEGSDEQPFYTATCGSAERLPNGNTLIVESDFGRAFEVTPEKDIVWEYYNPHRAGADGQLVATLFDLVRLPEGYAEAWLP